MLGNVASLPRNLISLFLCLEPDNLGHAIRLIVVNVGRGRKATDLQNQDKNQLISFPKHLLAPVIAPQPTRTIELLNLWAHTLHSNRDDYLRVLTSFGI